MSDPLRDAVAEVVSVAIATRDALSQSLDDDYKNKELQQRIADWNAGRISDGPADGWFPHTSTAALIDLMTPRNGSGRFDKAIQRANALALSSPAAAHVLPKLEVIHRENHALIAAARIAAQKSRRTWQTIDAHCDAVNALAMTFALYDPPVQADASGTAGPARKTSPKRRRNSSVRALTQRQLQAMELYGKHNGVITKVALEMGIKHSSAIQHLKAVWRKLPDHAPKNTKGRHRLTALPTDERGQVAVGSHRLAKPNEVNQPARRRTL